MEINKIYQEPCLETLQKMEDNSIDCVITSPPYWQLRDYGYKGQWGLEPTFQEYLEHLWSMMDLIYQKIKPSGTCWINLGDTYGTQSGGLRGKNTFDPKNRKATESVIEQPKTIHKCLLLIPHRFAIGCIDRGWIMRNDCIWAKRNGMPESVTDRFSKKHEYFFFMVKSDKYFFDLDAIRDKTIYTNDSNDRQSRWSKNYEGLNQGSHKLNPKAKNINGNMTIGDLTRTTAGLSLKTAEEKQNPNGKNPGSVSDFWDIPTKPSLSKHYASYNTSLLIKPVLAGCPEGGIIYDPFMGTGSTAEIALMTNRLFIGSEMSAEYCDIANKRLEPLLSQKNIF